MLEMIEYHDGMIVGEGQFEPTDDATYEFEILNTSTFVTMTDITVDVDVFF